jgi:hypothetical protein
MATKQTDTVAMTDEQLDGVSGGPHYKDFRGRFPLVGGTMCRPLPSEQPPAEQNLRPIWKRER